MVHALEEDPIDSRVVGLEPAEPFDGRDPAVLESIDSHDPGENRRILGNTDLAECATAFNADYGFGVVDRLDDGVTRTLIAQGSQAANDDGADGDGLLVFLIFGNQRLDRFVFRACFRTRWATLAWRTRRSGHWGPYCCELD